jgi:hypothetical protein
MTEYWLCDAGTTLREQVDKRWPRRDKASDGWIGDTSHQATPSDHNPDPDTGVVRAIDIDRDLSKTDPKAMERMVGQLRRYCRDRQDNDRVSYIIFDGLIASNTYGWVWRPYSGTNPHDHHCHISFLPRGDHRGAGFTLPVFTSAKRSRLRRLIQRLADRREALARRIGKTRKRLAGLR